MPLFGPPNIEKMEAKRDCYGLSQALSYKQDSLKEEHTQVRLAAAKALGNLKDPRSVPLLNAALGDKEREVRIAAAKALAQIGDPRAVEPLIHILELDDDNGVRLVAAKALGIFGDPHDGETLLRSAFDTKPESVRKRASAALNKLDVNSASAEDKAWYWVYKEEWEKCVSLGEPAVTHLIIVLEDKKPDKRVAAVSTLGKIGDPRSVAPLVTMLKDKDGKVRLEAAKALDSMGWKPASTEEEAWYWIGRKKWKKCAALGEIAIPPLIAVLGDSEVCSAAVDTLILIGIPAIKPLIAELDKGNVRIAAIEALGEIGDASCVDGLILVVKHSNNFGRIEAIRALGKIGDARAVEILIPFLGKKDDTHSEAAKSLLKLYKSRKLGDREKQAILAQRDAMMSRSHEDSRGGSHTDANKGRGCEVDYYTPWHSDHSYPGVDFPL